MEIGGGGPDAPISLEGIIPLVGRGHEFLEQCSRGLVLFVITSTHTSQVLGEI